MNPAPFLELTELASIAPRAVVDALEARMARPEPKHKAFEDASDDRFWIFRQGRAWIVAVPYSWYCDSEETDLSISADRFEDALALVRLGVDTDKTTYLAVVGQLVQVRSDVRLAA